jgi:hypothetical protein
LIVSVDTSVWIAFLRRRPVAQPLIRLLEENVVEVHAFVLAELVLGNLGDRHESLLDDLARLGAPPPRAHEEAMAFISHYALHRSGIGYVDAHLLASAEVERHRLWTLDRDLAHAAKRLGVGFVPQMNTTP